MDEPELSPETIEEIERLAPVAAQAQHITVLTGAGVSAESGVPTFRDVETGLWAKYDPVMLASVEGFNNDPATVWKWYDMRRQTMQQVEPNPGHHALAEWEQAWLERSRQFNLVTQNIDDLHARAGSSEIIELHGNIWYVRPVDGTMAEAYRLEECPLAEHPPLDAQGRMLRPHVVWFGEMLDPMVLDSAFHAAATCDLMLSVGTSSMVYPAAGLPFAAKRAGAAVVEVNPNATDLTASADYVLQGGSGAVLPVLIARIKAQLGG